MSDRTVRKHPDEIVELVVTGPESPAATNRDTSVVVRDLFAHAQHSVLVAGYAVYQGQKVFQALADSMQQRPELDVTMLLDIQRKHGDTTAPELLVAQFASDFRRRQWPPDRPLPAVFHDPRSLSIDTKQRACLHAKCVVVDNRELFISSANFTEAAQQRNIEIGLLVKSPWTAKALVRHFHQLIEQGDLERTL